MNKEYKHLLNRKSENIRTTKWKNLLIHLTHKNSGQHSRTYRQKVQIYKIRLFQSANYILPFRTCIQNQIVVNTLRFREIPRKFWMSRTLNYYNQIQWINPLLNQRLGKPLNSWRMQQVLIKFETKCQLKSVINHLTAPLVRLFNFIISKGTFPDSWSTGMITPIFKSGSRSDPSNYRGVCVTSSLGKLFCSILNTRLSVYFHDQNIFHSSQIGLLRRGYRTTDHIFTLRTLIDKYVKNENRGKLFRLTRYGMTVCCQN